jgi:hypothetical protein
LNEQVKLNREKLEYVDSFQYLGNIFALGRSATSNKHRIHQAMEIFMMERQLLRIGLKMRKQ